MKKTLMILVLCFFVLIVSFCADEANERIWFIISSSNVKSINLGRDVIYPARYKAIWSSSDSVGNANTGTYNGPVNVLCNVGIANTDHQIVFRFSTSGRFISETDPAAYRDFYIVAKPKIRFSGVDYEYCFLDEPLTGYSVIDWPLEDEDPNDSQLELKSKYPVIVPSLRSASGASKSEADFCPNTKTTSEIVIYSPQLVVHHPIIDQETGKQAVDSDNNPRFDSNTPDTYYYLQRASGTGGKMASGGSYSKDADYSLRAERFYFDILIAMDPLQENGVDHTLHMIEDQNYFATVTVSAECTVPGCNNPQHNLSYTFIIRGYYTPNNTNTPALRELFMFVHPDAQSTNLDIANVIATQNAINSNLNFDDNQSILGLFDENNDNGGKIADIEVLSLPKQDYDWKSKVTVLITASPAISKKNTSDPTTFKLKHTDSDIEIPFKLVVRKKNTDEIQVFDGSSPSSKLDLSTSQDGVKDKMDKDYNSLNYDGEIYIVLKDEATGRITEMVNSHTVVYTKVKISDYLSNPEHTGLTGLYTSYIYYHIFKD